MEEVQENSALVRLSFLIGNWRTEGEVIRTSKAPALKIKGTDSYEWALDGKFILHKASVMMGDVPTEVIEFIGIRDIEKDKYEMRSFDNSGAFTTMQASVNEGMLLITGDKMRSRLGANKGGDGMSAHWEKLEDGKNWVPWMELKFKKNSRNDITRI